MYLTQAIKRAAQLLPSSVSTWCAGRERLWPQTLERVAKMAGALQSLGLESGDRVAILALNSDRYFEYFYAVPWAGGVFVPINIRLAPPEVEFWLNDSEASILLIDDQFLPVLDAISAKLPALRTCIYIGDGVTPPGMQSYEALLADAQAVPDSMRGHDDLAGLFYTGGTTGRSKGVMLSHQNMVCNSFNALYAFDLFAGMRWLHAAPMFHIADGLAVFGVSMSPGSHYFIEGFTPERTLQSIADHRITNTLLVPTMINVLVNHPEVQQHDLASLGGVIYGASPMPEAVIKRAMQVMPHCRFYHAYGQTECAPILTCTGPEYHVLEGPNAGMYRSAGRAVPGVELRIVDEGDNEVPRGVVGEICGRGPNIMLGYWRQPELSAAVLKDGWMHTGDGGYMDENGFVYIVDRMKDMIISGGENIYSAEVEDAIYRHPSVAECAVIGIPDDEWGESVHAVVRCRDAAHVEENEIIEHCRSLIAHFKCPRSVSIRIDPMPLSGAGKILKTELRDPFWKGRRKQVN